MANSQQRSPSNVPSPPKNRLAHQEFGTPEAALQRPTPELPPNQQQLRVQVSRKGRGGKTVTVVNGFQSRPETLAALVKTLKAQCGAGGTAKEAEIEIQGDHREKVLQTLVKLGYKAKLSGG